MAKRRKIVRRAKKVSPTLSPVARRNLKRLQKLSNIAYKQFWDHVLIPTKPPRPPGYFPLVAIMAKALDINASGYEIRKR